MAAHKRHFNKYYYLKHEILISKSNDKSSPSQQKLFDNNKLKNRPQKFPSAAKQNLTPR
jgi:hypothetical protein